MNSNKTAKTLTAGIITIIILALCLSITTFALVYATVSVENNIFRTGSVKINLNDGKAIITEDEFIFEPGMTVVKDFFIENESTWEVYYKIYFSNLSGGLADLLEVTLTDGERVLYSGSASDLSRENTVAADDTLKIGERRDLQITFYFPPEVGNNGQDLSLSFDFCADAVQTKNNPNKLFD